MRALVFDGSSAKLVADRPAPAPAPGEALIKPTRLAISSIDLDLLRKPAGGPPPTFTGVMGHEFVGTVVDINLPKDAPAALETRRRLKGKRVVAPMNLVCGKCELCRGGLSSHCRSRAVLGALGRDGCFAEAFTLPLSSLHAVPDSVDDDAAVFASLVAAAAHAAQMLRIEGKPYITVLGDGPLGLITAQVMTRLNASVRLLGKHPEKFSLCERWGVKHRLVSEVGKRADQDVVVDCTGDPSGLALAMQLVRPRGKIILKTTSTRLPIVPGAPIPGGDAWSAINLAPLVVNEIELLGCRCGSIDHALGLLSRSEVNTASLITRRFKFDQLPSALAAAPASVKVVIDP